MLKSFQGRARAAMSGPLILGQSAHVCPGCARLRILDSIDPVGYYGAIALGIVFLKIARPEFRVPLFTIGVTIVLCIASPLRCFGERLLQLPGKLWQWNVLYNNRHPCQLKIRSS